MQILSNCHSQGGHEVRGKGVSIALHLVNQIVSWRMGRLLPSSSTAAAAAATAAFVDVVVVIGYCTPATLSHSLSIVFNSMRSAILNRFDREFLFVYFSTLRWRSSEWLMWERW